MTARTIPRSRRWWSIGKTRLDLFLDLVLALAFVVVMEEHFTGIQLHELIGLGFGVGLLVHIVLHWRWIVNITLHFFRKLFHESRFNYLLNLILFVDLLVATVTGIAISRTLGLNLGLDRSLMQSWQRLHIQTSELSLLIVALHVAVHWRWIVTHARKYLFRLPRLPFRRPAPTATPAGVPAGVASIPGTSHPAGGSQ